ncbi:MAG TPA: type II CAAX endopeptidase family protein [Pyrinomonadaceae bacterium]
MDLRSIFINNVGRLRSGWRVLIFVLAFVATGFLITTALRVLYALLLWVFPSLPYANFIENVIFRFELLATALIAAYLCLRLLEGLPWRALGLTFHDHWFRDLLVGSVIGIASLALGVGVAFIGGGLKFNLNRADLILGVARSLLSSGTLFMIAALAEEAIFRGYPLQTLTRAGLAWMGVLLTSLPFAFSHLLNPNVVPGVTFANTALAGIWLAVAYLRTRSLWFPLGVHWGWNWALGSLFDLPVSGLHLVSRPLLEATDTGPGWLTGGSYGLEGGVAGTVALLLSTLFIWRIRFVSATPEMLKLTSEENRATPSHVLTIRPTE